MARKPRTYFVLAVREDGVWAQQFGDYDRETVEFELEDHIDHDVKRRDLKILKTLDTEAAAREAVAKLNA
jgi:hypothetical protein